MSGTSKAQADRAVVEVDVLCDLASVTIRSFTPIGLGPSFEREAKELDAMLADVRRRFERVIRRGQRRGWADR